eukprot:9891589-Alexandrium_andersonii.AAC.1
MPLIRFPRKVLTLKTLRIPRSPQMTLASNGVEQTPKRARAVVVVAVARQEKTGWRIDWRRLWR